MDAIELLKEDHQKLKKILKTIEKTTAKTASKRKGLLAKAKAELIVHEAVEEALVYPILKKHKESHALTLEAYAEHHFANMILKEVEKTAAEDENWLANFSVFKENIYHHIKEEEGELFKLLKKTLDKPTLQTLTEEIKMFKKNYNKDVK